MIQVSEEDFLRICKRDYRRGFAHGKRAALSDKPVLSLRQRRAIARLRQLYGEICNMKDRPYPEIAAILAAFLVKKARKS